MISDAELYLFLKTVGQRSREVEKHLPELLKRGLQSGIYHLQLEVLEYIQIWSQEWSEGINLSKGYRGAIELILTSFETDNLLLSTKLVQTLSAFNLIQLGIDAEDVRLEILDMLTRPNDSSAQESAERVISNMFEEMCGEIYCEAIEKLSIDERCRLFSMAALGIPTYSMCADFILEELLKIPTAEATRAFQRFATEIVGESNFPQGAAKCFILAHHGSAQMCKTPWRLSNLEDDDRKAWQCYGEIFFWLAKRDLTLGQVRDQCIPLWSTLSQDLKYAAIDPLMRFAHTRLYRPQGSEEDPIDHLFSEFRHQIRQILEQGLQSRERLTSIDRQWQNDFKGRERTTFVLHTLGQIGIPSTVSLLRPFVEDEYFGEIAVEAIRAIDSGEPFVSLAVMLYIR